MTSKTKRNTALLLFITFILLWLSRPCWSVRFDINPAVREGDIIFHNSTSSQSRLIMLATGSPLTHCGIIVMKDNRPYVLEATKTLRLTPLKDFIRRGRRGAYWLKRPRSSDSIRPVRYAHLLGRDYDLSFTFDNDKYYCSELVYDIYKYQFGITLCTPRMIKSYNTFGMEDKMRERGMNPNSLVVAPSDIFDSDELQDVD